MMKKLYLAQHAESEWDVEGRFQGRTNSLLTHKGRCQAALMCESLRYSSLSLIISSPSPRALESAQMIRGTRTIPIIQDEHFLEMNFGDWEGQLMTDIEKSNPVQSELFWNYPHLFKNDKGEDFYQVRERVLPRLKYILNEYRGHHLLVMTHPIVYRMINGYYNHIPIEKIWDKDLATPPGLKTINIEEPRTYKGEIVTTDINTPLN